MERTSESSFPLPHAFERACAKLRPGRRRPRMRFFFPDSQDLVDPSFDFETEERSAIRTRHRDDEYAHEVFASPPFDGLLVSKGMVDGFAENGSRYSIAQRHRLLRVGAPSFFRVPLEPHLPIMGDCGAFA